MKYGKINEIQRFGIQEKDGSTVVEIYLKTFNLFVVHDSGYFDFRKVVEKEV